MTCIYCGYQGNDEQGHREIHVMLDELVRGDMPDVRFRRLWAELAIRLEWQFTCYGPTGHGRVEDNAGAWSKWAGPQTIL